jgi:hypothetical protein
MKAHEPYIQFIDYGRAENMVVAQYRLDIAVALNSVEAGKDSTLPRAAAIHIVKSNSPEHGIIGAKPVVDARCDDIGVVCGGRKSVVVADRITAVRLRPKLGERQSERRELAGGNHVICKRGFRDRIYYLQACLPDAAEISLTDSIRWDASCICLRGNLTRPFVAEHPEGPVFA